MKRCPLLIWMAFILALTSCTKRISYSPIPPEVISSFSCDQDNVRSVLWTGKISMKGANQNMDANILVIAKKRPFSVRIEVSNWLAGPIMYMVIDKKKILILSIKEKKAYISSLDNINRLTSINIVPPKFTRQDIWPVLRAMPCIHHKGSEEKMILFGDDMVSLFLKDTMIQYKDYKKYQGLIFAQKIRILYYPTQTSWEFSIRNIQFNKKIPSNIFKLNIPPNFQILYQP